ncbi:MAG: hypothetical protein P8K76_06965 [Candidatus Binatia bacterium]|nr:hypothetical protein [Candidatus Binatia bacterium]
MRVGRRAEKIYYAPSRSHPAAAPLVALLIFFASACTAVRPTAAPSDAAPFTYASRVQKILNPSTTMPNGAWLGGDVAASIPITDDMRIWLFGDTLVGSFQTDCPKGTPFCDREIFKGKATGPVHNSVGVLRGLPGSYQPIERFWGEKPDGAPTSFFAADDPDHYLWPLSGVSLEGGLVILANENSATSGLSPVAAVLLHVLNPLDAPTEWEVRQRALPFRKSTPEDQRSLSITSAVVRRGKFLIVVGSRRDSAGKTATILARLPVSALQDFDGSWAWEWWMHTDKNEPEWSAPLEFQKLATVQGLPASSESTIDRRQDQLWETYQIQGLTYDIHRFTAEVLEGPWQDSGAVYHVPPPWSLPARRHCGKPLLRSARTRQDMAARRQRARNLMCRIGNFVVYAPKSHPGLSPNGEQTLTYNVNLFFGTLKGLSHAVGKFPGFYVPRAVRQPTPRRQKSPAQSE